MKDAAKWLLIGAAAQAAITLWLEDRRYRKEARHEPV